MTASPLPCRWLGRSLDRRDVVSSTMSECAAAAGAGAPDGHVVVARRQTAGRGRGDRRWHSADDGGLYFSALLRGFPDPARAAGITLAAGLGVGAAVAELGGVDVRLKWPNDVLLGERKAAGILTEWLAAGAVVVGVGLNIAQRVFPEDLRERATSLALAGVRPPPTVEQALGIVLRALERAFDHFRRDGLAWVVPEWTARSGLWGRRVRAAGASGTMVRLADDGSLVVREDGGGERTITAGDVDLL